MISDVVSSKYYPNVNDKEHTFDVIFKVTNNTKYNTKFYEYATTNVDTLENAKDSMLYIRLDENTLDNEYPEVLTFDSYSN